jgi:uncharacterized membrane protein (DUF106 family)
VKGVKKISCLISLALLVSMLGVGAIPVQAKSPAQTGSDQENLERIVKSLDTAVMNLRKGAGALPPIGAAESVYEDTFSPKVENEGDNELTQLHNRIIETFEDFRIDPTVEGIEGLKSDIRVLGGENRVSVENLERIENALNRAIDEIDRDRDPSESISKAKSIYEEVFSPVTENVPEDFYENFYRIRRTFKNFLSVGVSEGEIFALRKDILSLAGEFGISLPPLRAYSLFIILFISLVVSFLITFVNKRTVNWELVRSHKARISDFMREYREALRRQDRKRLHKLELQRPEIRKLQGELMSHQLKPTLYYLIPLLLLWGFVLGPVFGGWIVAWLPFRIDLPVFGPLVAFGVGWWYIITFFGFSTIFRAIMIPEAPPAPVKPPAW